MKRMWLLVILIIGSLAVDGTDPNNFEHYVRTRTFSSTAFPNGFSFYFGRNGPISQSLYWFGMGTDGGGTSHSTITKIDKDGNQIFSKSYNLTPLFTSFVIDSLEEYAYFPRNTGGTMQIVEVNCSTGLYSRDFSNSDIQISNPYHRLNPIPGSSGVIFSGFSLSNNNHVVGKFAGGSSSLEGFSTGLTYPPRSTLAIDSNIVFYSKDGTADITAYFIRADFSLPSKEVWSNKVPCPTASGVGFGGLSLYDSSTSNVHVLHGFQSVVLYFSLSINDGSLQGTQYIDDNTGGEIFDLQMHEGLVYMTYNGAIKILTVFDPSTDSVKE